VPPDNIISEFEGYVATGLADAGLRANELQEYEIADPAWMNAQGLIRYGQKHSPEGHETDRAQGQERQP
jgi:hypothetical protein